MYEYTYISICGGVYLVSINLISSEGRTEAVTLRFAKRLLETLRVMILSGMK